MIKTILLIRHAEAETLGTGTPKDYKRALTENGKLEAIETAKVIKELFPSDNIMFIVSTAERTENTAIEIQKTLQAKSVKFAFEQNLYTGTEEDCLNVIFENCDLWEDDEYDLIFIGHNPMISEVAKTITKDESFKGFKTAGCVLLELDFSEDYRRYKLISYQFYN